MKKHILTLSLLLLAAQYAAGITKNDVMQVLVSSHNLAFGKDNLYAQQIPFAELQKWDEAIRAAKSFVEANSKNQLGIKDGDLISALSTIESANMNLINAIKVIRASTQSPYAIKQNIDILDKIKQAMLIVQSKLKNATFVLNKAEKMLAKDILISMAMFIETTAAKAIRDTSKI